VRRGAVWTAGVLLGSLAFAGCLVGPDYHRPDYPVPQSFRGEEGFTAAPEGSLGDVVWWRVFEDEHLVELIGTALAENYDLRIAVARILDARAQLVIARSFLFPTIGAGASASYTRFIGSSGQFDPQLQQLNDLFDGQGGFDVAYEIDFWGRIRRTAEAARGQLFASEYARQTVISTLVSDVARAYFELRGLDEQLEIAQQTLASRARSLRLVRQRQQGGVASLLDVRQSEVLVENAAEVIPLLQRQIAQRENEISVLIGRDPGPVDRGRPLDGQLALPPVPPGLTSALLERRPDIRQVEQDVVSANAQIGAAKALYFPQVTLTGFGGVGGNVFNNAAFGPFGIIGISPAVTVPVFTAGRVQGGVDSAVARTQATILRYQQTIQQAFREVSDSLVAYEKNRQFRIEKEYLVTTLRDAVRLANIRYQGGVSSYLEVLDTETRLFDAELTRVLASLNERVAVVQLYKALGGGWQRTPNGSMAAPRATP
jgi:outer membrane protein, multidrug efflux system